MEIVGNWDIHSVKNHFLERKIVTNESMVILNLKLRKQKMGGNLIKKLQERVKMIDSLGEPPQQKMWDFRVKATFSGKSRQKIFPPIVPLIPITPHLWYPLS